METGDPAAAARQPNLVERPIRTAEVVGALSIATDLGTGQPLEHALRTAVLAVRLGELAGACTQELADTYYVALLHASGCTSNGHEATQLYGDDIDHRAAFYLIDTTSRDEVLAFYKAHVGAGRSPEVRAKLIEDALANAGPRARDAFSMMCEVAQRFAAWLGLGGGIPAALEYVFARWDGRGVPDIAGDAIPLPMRLLHVARDVSLFLSAAGADEARAVIERRAGAAYDPRLAELAKRNFDELLAELDETRMWAQALDTEPTPLQWIAGDRIDTAFAAVAAISGLKSPWLREHSTSVSELAEAAGWRMGLAEQVEGLYGCLDYYQHADDPFSRELLDRYNRLYPSSAMFTGGAGSSGMYRGLRLWEAAVREADSLDQEDVIAALDHAKLAVGPGGPAEMVPGQHHVRMNMCIAQVRGGAIKAAKNLGVIDPDEPPVPSHRLALA